MRRIAVVGPGGAGKSRFSERLGARLGLPVIHLDAHYWRPGWTEPSPDEWRAQQDGVGVVESWNELIDVRGDLVTFRSRTRFDRHKLAIESRSTLRFGDRPELEATLADSGFTVVEIRDAPDRPGLEYVFIANRR